MKAQPLLDLIDNGEWHSLNELAQELNASLNEVTKIVESLEKCTVVTHLKESQQVRLRSWIRNLLADLRFNDEEKVALGTIILPPESNITIQNTVISNFTEDDLEIGVRIDKKLKELAISRITKATTKQTCSLEEPSLHHPTT